MRAIRRRTRIAFLTRQALPLHADAPGLALHPGPLGPRRIVAYMLIMSAGQFCHPILVFVEMKTDDGLIHALLAFQ